ncbi:MAG TPA: hypothetical protein VJ982_07925 [Gemmatimonadota bacterium]|nr:hypothetical protein [Gemmatimonadota bacterium]
MQRFAWLPAALLLGLLASPRLAAGQEPETPPRSEHACPAGETCPMPHEGMEARHAAMMQMHDQNAARLQELQDEMHAATGGAKVDAVAALLDEMLAQHRAMHAMMMGMRGPGAHHDGMKREADPDSGR